MMFCTGLSESALKPESWAGLGAELPQLTEAHTAEWSPVFIISLLPEPHPSQRPQAPNPRTVRQNNLKLH